MAFIALVPPIAVNVAQYGASPSNAAAANDAAFAAAIAAVPAGGGAVVFPGTGYLISAPITVDKDAVTLWGFGQRNSAATITVDSSVDPSYALIVGNTKNVNSCTIAGLSFIGRGTTTSTGKGILFRSNGGKLYQVKVALFGGDGIDISSFSGTNFEVFLEDIELVQNGMNAITPGDNLMMDSLVSDCEFHRVISQGDITRTTTRYGINVNGAFNCKFIDSHAYYCSYGLINGGTGTQVIGGEWENNVNSGIVVNSVRATIMGATFNLNGTTDISVNSGPTTIVGNLFNSTATFANIYANNTQGGVIADNEIAGCPTCIQLDAGSTLYQVHDNVFNATGTNVLLIKATNSDIHDNNVTGTGGGNIVEQTGAQGNNIHDNTLIGGGTITQIGTTTRIRNNIGFNPRGHAVTQPAIAATTVAVTNTTGCDCTVHILGGTLTLVSVGGTSTGITAAAAAGTTHCVRVPVGQTIAITYSVAPTWSWFGD